MRAIKKLSLKLPYTGFLLPPLICTERDVLLKKMYSSGIFFHRYLLSMTFGAGDKSYRKRFFLV